MILRFSLSLFSNSLSLRNRNLDADFEKAQPFDSSRSSPSGPKMDYPNGDKLRFLQNVVPFDNDDDVGVENVIGTQVMDIESETETQVTNPCCETQEVNLTGETQLMDDCFETQLLDQLDDEVAADSDEDGTEVLDDNGDLSDGDSLGRCNAQLSGKEKTRQDNLRGDEVNVSVELSDALIKERRNSGQKVSTATPLGQNSPQPQHGYVARFTSVRTAAFRASGLAARDALQKIPNSESRSILTNCRSSDQGTVDKTSPECNVGEEVDQLFVPGSCSERVNGSKNGNKTARRLFVDGDSPAETEKDSHNHLTADCNDELAGLSYIDSQEPGEASQANVLNFVEKFINDNCLDFEYEAELGKRICEKPKHVSSVKGTKVVAKKAGYRDGGTETGAFDWDDSREDEGGGDILCRRREAFFGSESHLRSSLTVPKKPKGKWLHGHRDNDELVDTTGQILSHSDSRLLCHNLMEKGKKVQEIGMEKTKKKLVNELDRELKANDIKTSVVPEVVGVGPDTQMAAEAIEALQCGDISNLHVDNGFHQDVQNNQKISLMEKALSSRGESGLSDGGVVTRQSKKTKRIDSTELFKARTKRTRSVPAKISEKKIEDVLKSDQLDKSDKFGGCSLDKKQQQLTEKRCDTKLPNQSSYQKRRRSSRNLSIRINESHANCNNHDDRNEKTIVKPSISAFDTPVKCKAPVNNASPLCMGDEYLRQSCKNSSKSASWREIRTLTSPVTEPVLESKSPRKRRDLGSVRVLLSQHLDEDVTKRQRKILGRLGISEASSIVEATHFVADQFVRTRNMLEAIASGKPVVTPLWLESIGQVKIYIDEEGYILRDTQKEKEFGFSMPVSLARARQHPLLQGRRVFITPNTKPGRATIMSLVKAVHGQAVERLGRSALNDDKVADNFLVISCEEDYNICVSFLERGAEVYSSELLLNGIVTQKLEYERHLLFADHVKRTRSTIWLRNDKGEFLPVTK